jgi:2',3'-cyclic-nucleotide 2'-phosphodiesterase
VRLLFLGDIVGRSGRDAIVAHLPALRRAAALDLVVANGENAASGFGITDKICHTLFEAGVDVITLGDHSWDRPEIGAFIDKEPRLLRPINYPSGLPGRGSHVYETKTGKKALVVNVLGQVFMGEFDNPFEAVGKVLKDVTLGRSVDCVFVDMHCEATSEKMAMGHFCDGRASLVAGTHTHVPTADSQILPGGTAFQSDAGMCGDYNSVIGMDKAEPMLRFTRKTKTGRFEPALGEGTMCGVFVETDASTGLATSVEPVRIGGRLSQALPLGLGSLDQPAKAAAR